jgi:HK97 family phage major capsid protein
MSAEVVLEELKGEVAQLAATVRDHATDKATIDQEQLAKDVAALVDKQVAARLADHEADKPVRKGEIIGAPGFQVRSKGLVRGGKFDGQRVDDLIFANWLLGRAGSFKRDNVRPPSKDLTEAIGKALDTTTGGSGDEYVPTGMAAELWQDMFIAAKVAGTLPVINMPTDPFDAPLGWTSGAWRKGTANTAITAQDATTAKSTLTSTEQVYEVDWSYDLDEDSIIAVLPSLKAELTRDGAEQIDRFILNADSTNAGSGNINSDDADPADDSYYLSKGQDGIRHLYLVDNTGQSTNINTTLTDALVLAGIGRLGKYAADNANLAIAADARTYIAMLGLTNVATMDKFGPQATVLTGELAKYNNIPVIVSGAVSQMDSDGKYTTTTPTSNDVYGEMSIYHRPSWRVGFRRQLLIEVDQLIQRRMFIMVVSFRIAVAARGTRSTAVHTAGVHGIKWS